MSAHQTREAAIRHIEDAGFSYVRPAIMGAARWRRGPDYAWVEDDFCHTKCERIFRSQIRGQA